MEIYRSKEFEFAMNEYFDNTDRDTRKILLSVNEADQNKILTSLTSKLYDNIVDKVDDIDFGDIPNTRGDITKLPNYVKIIDSLELLDGILEHYKQDTTPVDTISNAVENLKLRKDVFVKAYQLNIEFPIIIYNTMTLAVIESLSYLIAAAIEFIKVPSQEGFVISLNKVALSKVKQHLLFENLEKFNKSCKNGEIDKAIDFVMKQNMKNFSGVEIGIIAGAALAIGIILNIIPIIRELIFLFYYTRTSISNYFDMQATLLQMNAYNVEAQNARDEEEKKRIVKKQLKLVDTFRKISNTIMVDTKKSENVATKDLVNSNKKMKVSDVVDELPDSASDSLF